MNTWSISELLQPKAKEHTVPLRFTLGVCEKCPNYRWGTSSVRTWNKPRVISAGKAYNPNEDKHETLAEVLPSARNQVWSYLCCSYLAHAEVHFFINLSLTMLSLTQTNNKSGPDSAVENQWLTVRPASEPSGCCVYWLTSLANFLSGLYRKRTMLYCRLKTQFILN